MSYLNNTPHQLDKIRKDTQDKLYARQPQLMKKLALFMNRANLLIPEKKKLIRVRGKIISEPFKGRKTGLVRSKNKRQLLRRVTKVDLIKEVNIQRNNLKKQRVNNTRITRISQIPARIIWGLR